MIKKVYNKFRRLYKWKKYVKKWRIINSHNETIPKNEYPESLVKIGNCTYGLIDIDSYGMPDEMLQIGSFCSIASNVLFITGGGHYLDRFTTFPLNRKLNKTKEETSKGPIVVEDDVWLGYGAKILSGVTIGQGAVIGSFAVVAKDIPPYAIVVGNPGKILRYRFNQQIIDKLLTVDFNNLKLENLSNLYQEIVSSENIDEIIKCLDEK